MCRRTVLVPGILASVDLGVMIMRIEDDNVATHRSSLDVVVRWNALFSGDLMRKTMI